MYDYAVLAERYNGTPEDRERTWEYLTAWNTWLIEALCVSYWQRYEETNGME